MPDMRGWTISPPAVWVDGDSPDAAHGAPALKRDAHCAVSAGAYRRAGQGVVRCASSASVPSRGLYPGFSPGAETVDGDSDCLSSLADRSVLALANASAGATRSSVQSGQVVLNIRYAISGDQTAVV
jgi:hypothetical protein